MNTSIPINDISRLLRNLIRIRTVAQVDLIAGICRVNTGDAVTLFTGQVQRMAKVHQYGLRDRPSVRAKEMQYPARRLLGLDAEDMKLWKMNFNVL